MNLEQKLETVRKESTTWKELVAQRDELLAALRMSRDCFRRMDRTARREEALRVIDAAIANSR